jgi:hypothetical protein
MLPGKVIVAEKRRYRKVNLSHVPEVRLGEAGHSEREEPQRTVGAVQPLRRALV